MSVSDSRDTTAQQMIDLAQRNQREVVALRNALTYEQDRRRKAQGELNMLKGRINQIADNMTVAAIHLKGAPHPRRGHHILDLTEYANRLRKVTE